MTNEQKIALLKSNTLRRFAIPGCNQDKILVITGDQGSGKTRTLSEAATSIGAKFIEIDDIKDVDRNLLCDLNSVKPAILAINANYKNKELIKSFITKNHDEFRRPYAKTIENEPRKFAVAIVSYDSIGFINRRFDVIEL